MLGARGAASCRASDVDLPPPSRRAGCQRRVEFLIVFRRFKSLNGPRPFRRPSAKITRSFLAAHRTTNLGFLAALLPIENRSKLNIFESLPKSQKQTFERPRLDFDLSFDLPHPAWGAGRDKITVEIMAEILIELKSPPFPPGRQQIDPQKRKGRTGRAFFQHHFSPPHFQHVLFFRFY